MTFYIYILYSESSDLFYIGHTSDYLKRLTQHNNSDFNTFTSKHRPWKFAAVFEVGDSRAEAMKIEKFIKNQKNRTFIETIINPNFKPNGKLSMLVRVPNLRD